MGTPSYMSPEQALGQPVGASSDVFSLGFVLFELVAGKRPFDGTTTVETLHRIIETTPVSVRSTERSLRSWTRSSQGVCSTSRNCDGRPRTSRRRCVETARAGRPRCNRRRRGANVVDSSWPR
ncbi:MAG: protein kinase domain-containing protein [Thermoanaerobaculia bacterium]